jgi:hypothetical protein
MPTTCRAQNSSGGGNLPPRRIIRSRSTDAEPAAHKTIAPTAPKAQLRRTVCIGLYPSGMKSQNSRRTFNNR